MADKSTNKMLALATRKKKGATADSAEDMESEDSEEMESSDDEESSEEQIPKKGSKPNPLKQWAQSYKK